MELNKIYLGDCLELMKGIPDKSVDAVICDLPYECLNKSNKQAQWDKQLPLDRLWEHWLRLRRNERTPIILFGQGIFTAKLIMSQPKLFKYTLVWDKVLKNGFLNANRMPLRQHEDILVFYRELPTYNPQMTKCEPNKRNHSKGSMKNQTVNRCYGQFVDLPTKISDDKFPTSIISIPKQHINGKSYHPTEKPVALLEYLIRTYTNDGDTVLDNCIGSGTTAIAAIREKRNFIGFELNEEYYNIANKRIKLELMQPRMF